MDFPTADNGSAPSAKAANAGQRGDDADSSSLFSVDSIADEKQIVKGKRDVEHRESVGSIESIRSTESLPPNGGYGWVCTAASTLMNAHTWGIHSAYGVFLAYFLANDTFPGTTPLAYAFVGSLGVACSLLISPVATIIARQFGTRRTMFAGAVLEGLGLALASLSTKIWHLVLTQGVLFGFGMGLLFVPAATIVPQWFSTRRSLANGISASGSGLGGVLYALAAGTILRTLGVQWAYNIFAIIAFTVNAICAFLLRDRNKDIGSSQLAFKTVLFRRPEFCLVISFSCFSMLGYIILIFSLANYGNKIGLDAAETAFISGLFNLGQAVGRPTIGFLSDRTGRINIAAVTSLLTSAFILAIWLNAFTKSVFIVFAVLCGCVAGTFSATIGPVTAEIVGLRNMPSALNLIWLSILLPVLLSEPSALQIVAATGNYRGTQFFTGGMFLGAAISLLAVRGWKINQVREWAKLGAETPGLCQMDQEAFVDAGLSNAGIWTMLFNCWRWGKV